ncbi:uncharacterized protein LOC129600497 [Paramacrobiotus metropolitanus]|uniref:uncharacterized protein LOC129600497 n=1 Tax=Paramacrobiotus metropolitanus TaxID=2943436 RepID=UPI0024458389|nr:uncharacterized protein LOC129600497 [Paramacrobiotus metropolitanus]
MPATVLLFILPLLPLLPYSAAQAAWYAQPVQVTVGTGEFDLKNASTWMWCHHCADELDEVTGAQTKPFCTENEWDFDTAMKQCPSKYCQVSMRRFSKRVSDYPTVINHRASKL